MNNKNYDIDEEDLQKLKANSEKMLVQLKQIIVHPSSVIVIEPYFKDWYQLTIKNKENNTYYLGEPKPPSEIKDLFDNTVLKLTGKK